MYATASPFWKHNSIRLSNVQGASRSESLCLDIRWQLYAGHISCTISGKFEMPEEALNSIQRLAGKSSVTLRDLKYCCPYLGAKACFYRAQGQGT